LGADYFPRESTHGDEVMMSQEWATANPAKLTEILQDRIQWRTGGRIRQLCVVTGNDRVVIQGMTSSFYLKQLALAAILEVIGSTAAFRVTLDIHVNGSSPQVRDGVA